MPVKSSALAIMSAKSGRPNTRPPERANARPTATTNAEDELSPAALKIKKDVVKAQAAA